MTTLLHQIAFLAGFLAFCASAAGEWQAIPLKERLKDAELVVVGKLSDVVQRDFSITFSNKEVSGKAYTSYYDRGAIRTPKVLKGSLDGSSYASVAFDSKGQGTHPLRHMLLPHKAGEVGIWLLRKDRALTGYFFVISYPENPVPLDSEAEVVKLLKEMEQQK